MQANKTYWSYSPLFEIIFHSLSSCPREWNAIQSNIMLQNKELAFMTLFSQNHVGLFARYFNCTTQLINYLHIILCLPVIFRAR